MKDEKIIACSLAECSVHLERITQEMQGVIVGQRDVIDQLLVALLAGGHVLIEGVPGIAKTLIIRSLSLCLDCSFVRIQFTPDLLPADITGTRIFDRNTGLFSTEKGPIFHHFVLADEINRAPPKVQSALLEAMQERQVTIQGETWGLDAPFFVLATENPIESEGTYPLPEAQLDRFMFKVTMTHPDLEDEVRILERYAGSDEILPRKIVNSREILGMQALTRSIRTERRVLQYAAGIVDATRHPDRYGLGIKDFIAYGASPRASLALVLGAKARAVISGRDYVIPEDIKAVALPALRHRILLTFEAETDGITTDRVAGEILDAVPVP